MEKKHLEKFEKALDQMIEEYKTETEQDKSERWLLMFVRELYRHEEKLDFYLTYMKKKKDYVEW